MHVLYTPETTDYWFKFYKSTTTDGQFQLGGILPGFKAHNAFHRGAGLGNFFKKLFRIALPLLKTVGLTTVSNIASDVAQGRNFKQSATLHGRNAASSLLQEAADKIKVPLLYDDPQPQSQLTEDSPKGGHYRKRKGKSKSGGHLGKKPRTTQKPGVKPLKRRGNNSKKSFRVKQLQRAVASDIFGD